MTIERLAALLTIYRELPDNVREEIDMLVEHLLLSSNDVSERERALTQLFAKAYKIQAMLAPVEPREK